MSHTAAHKTDLVARLRRIAGQVAALQRAVEAEAGCATVLHQAAGLRGAVHGLMDELVEDHMRQHLARPGLTDAERAAAADELIAAIRRYAK
ncbi:metal/formaldehyde-sensitive transcriptional repressor [Ancylobacter sp. 6x-1]|uniref:Metal/formaldehyde-sensitive transcriptional repressor n=1 Tax=Ancylobacter crimeensis TaxID=2579147 RepID=A0ABT0D886_9HYPH|nr:metal/formaldehyde-sensitive transcriptional repressor [Ancylobacter crimeensis]MCK0196134.1 metal/formaldehyde-sensitive transcriptional repressor [Ancylobacter crimeensis]